MLFYRFLSLLLATGLLFGTLSCIKEPINVPGTGSYKFDNVERRCDAQGDISFPSRMNQVYDELSINLVTTPEPSTGPELLILTFSRPRTQPAPAYQLRSMVYRTASGAEAVYSVHTATIQEDRDRFTGTFSGASPAGTTPPLPAIVDGTFGGLHVEP
jgi:hypothetical protein